MALLDPIERIAELLRNCGSAARTQPPTMLYNEGWMLRLLLDWHSRQPVSDHPLAFLPEARWYSEALLPSQFLPRTRGDLFGESWTHADGVVGHFAIVDRRGDIRVNDDARQLVVVEAKMFSPLSGGTKRAVQFDQAARNVACIAEILHRAKRAPSTLDRIGFVVLAPAQQINAGVFGQLCEKDSIAAKVHERISAYEAEKGEWHTNAFEPLLERINISLLSWEDALEDVASHQPETATALRQFYSRCLAFNSRASSPSVLELL